MALAEAVERAAAALDAGLPLTEALERAAVAAVAATAPAGPICRSAQSALLAALRVTAVLGCPAAEVLRRVAAGVRESVSGERARRAAVAGPVAGARIVGMLPVAGPLVAVALGVNPLVVLVGTDWGRLCGLLGLLLLAAGRHWSDRLVARARSAADSGPAPPRRPAAAGARATTGRGAGRTRRRGGSDPALLVELVAAAVAGAGSPATALRAVAAAVDPPAVGGEAAGQGRAAELRRLATGVASGDLRLAPVSASLLPLRRALAFCQETGAPPSGPLLAAAREIRRAREAAAVRAANRLAAALVLPLGLTALPGFLLLGIAPVVVRLVTGALG